MLKINFILDQLLPPIVRDWKLFMKLPMHFVFSKKAEDVMNFKERLPLLSTEEYVSMYEDTEPYHLSKDIYLNTRCIEAVLKDIVGSSILEVGCGRGFLVQKICDTTEGSTLEVTATDIVLSDQLKAMSDRIKFLKAEVSDLPFAEKEFDTVICTHVLEHVIDLKKSINELRRVARKRLIIVVPMQRPYRYTFNLHLRFFPYVHSFLLEMMPLRKGTFSCVNMGGDIYYVENINIA
jgi:ubiquinone/menaquinone biosynthesis C-methylase UbiE